MLESRPELAPPLRWATPVDGDLLAATYIEAIVSGVSTMDAGPCTGADFEAKLLALQPREAVIIGEREGRYAGYAWLKRYSDRAGYRFACETSIFLARTAWGTGLANELQQAAIAEAQRLEYRHVVAKIMAVNERSIRFHKRHGFDVVGVQERIGVVGDTWHDVVILQRLL